MTRLDEETLNAYADGVLDADARARVEALLETDVAARELLEKLRRANTLAVQAFDEPMHEPVPQALIDRVLNRRGHEAGRAGGVQLQPRAPRSRSIGAYAIPIAATLALAIGIGTGLFLGRQSTPAADELALGPVSAEDPLHRLLESHPSGRFLEVDGSQGRVRRLSVVATFRDRHARACRELEVLPAGTDQQPLAAAVACRRAQGGWVVEGAARLAAAPSATGQDFGPSGVLEKDALDGLLAMLGAQAALSAEEEQGLMQRGWK